MSPREGRGRRDVGLRHDRTPREREPGQRHEADGRAQEGKDAIALKAEWIGAGAAA